MPGKYRLGRAGNYGLCLALLSAACNSDDTQQPMPEVPFETVSPAAYATKVKNLLTGLPLTDAELMAVTADSAALGGLIDTWMTLPEFDTKMLQFFQQGFQQTQLTLNSFSDQLNGDTLRFDNNNTTGARFLKSARESFARTALQLLKDGKPFTDVVTSSTYMLNAPLMSYLAYKDSMIWTDTGALTNRIVIANPSFNVVFTSLTTIPPAQSADPTNANYMRWTVPSPPTTGGCTNPTAPFNGIAGVRVLFDFMFGRLRNCNPTGTPAPLTSTFTQADFDTWRPITIRTPRAGETPSNFWDIAKLRTATELVLAEPKIGFFTTPAFFANWATNPSNQARVTANQTLIVALGKSFDDTINNNIPSIDEQADDTQHANPQSICYSCHKSLDPMRQFFRQSYTYFYSTQNNATEINTPATFAFDGVTMPGTGQGIRELGPFLAAHPRFATAWVNKMCYFANSTACEETDPELTRIAQVFRDSSYNFKTLLHELFSSPLVTLAARTQTFTNSEQPVSISRREHFCAQLSHRLGVADVCAIDAITVTTLQNSVRNMAPLIDGASYSRGAEAPVVSRDPNLFFRASVENICILMANNIVDNGTTPKYTSANYAAAIDDFVANVMALPPSDARAAAAKAILTEHYNAALAQSGMARDALRSTFVLACTAPTSVSIGL